MILLYFCIAWVAGIYSGSLAGLPIYSLIPGMVLMFFIPFFKQNMKPLLLSGLCLLVFAAGNLLYQSSIAEPDRYHLSYYNDKETVAITGFISSDPEFRDNTAVFQVKVDSLYINGETRDVSGKVLVRTSGTTTCSYGDILSLSGSLLSPADLDNFDYGRYLAARDIHSIMYYPSISKLGEDGGSASLAVIYKMRRNFSNVLSRALPEPQGALAQAILLGKRDDIPGTLMSAFSRTGTAHLLAISGLHLSIIIGMLLSLGAMLFGRRWSIHILIAFLIVWIYVILTGMRPPVVRGAIMGSMYLAAQFLGRQRSSMTALFFAAAIMLGLKPLLLWDASFQLSFLAMGGLIVISPPLRMVGKKYLDAGNNATGVFNKLGAFTMDTIAVTLSAILATWPVIAYHFGLISLTGLPATFFALPALPFIIVLSMLISIAGLVISLGGQIVGWLAWPFITYLIFIIAAYDSFSFTAIKAINIQVWQVLLYYALLAGVFLLLKYRAVIKDALSKILNTLHIRIQSTAAISLKARLACIVMPLTLLTVIVWGGVLTAPDGKLHVSVLDIGQGDAILVETPSGQNILIDGGPSPLAINLELGKKLSFRDKTIEMVILTQPDADHLTGLLEVLDHYQVMQVVQPHITSQSPLYDRWRTTLDQMNIPVTIVQAGQRIEADRAVLFDILHPPQQQLAGTSDDVDNNGLVLRLSYKDISFLLTADIYHEAEWNLIGEGAPLKSTVLKVPHHGSRTSSSIEFLTAVSPDCAVISAGSNNRFGHPHKEVTDRLTDCLDGDYLYCTAVCGAVEFISDGQRLWVKTSGQAQ